MTTLDSETKLAQGFANLTKNGRESAYAARHSRLPVNDFGRPIKGDKPTEEQMSANLFERAFPCMYPFGVGGLESPLQRNQLNFAAHIRWSLQYHDQRFRRHNVFPFLCFSILQKREALRSSKVQIRQNKLIQDKHLIAQVTRDKLMRAVEEERRNEPISDPAVQALRRHVYSVESRVNGTNQGRIRKRSQIWSTIIMMNPPSLWITINPCDLHDPILQFFAGEDIDIDDFMSIATVSELERAQNVADDPYACAKYFHFIITTALEEIIGMKKNKNFVTSKPGAFGRPAAYYGMVEAQGRGTLHLHLLLWLENTPTAEEMKEVLKDEAFRQKASEFIKANLKAYVPGLESEESVKEIPKDKDVLCGRPLDPSDGDLDKALDILEQKLARMQQIHKCRVGSCLENVRGGLKCKRKAPFPISEDDGVDETGAWRQKRLYGAVNGWAKYVLLLLRCNNDCKLVPSGDDAMSLVMYLTAYLAKKQGRNFNASAVMANAFAYHQERLRDDKVVQDARSIQKTMLFRLVNAMNREQELSAPLVISYLMGWGDTYTSHAYSPLYLSTFIGSIVHQYPELRTGESGKKGGKGFDL